VVVVRSSGRQVDRSRKDWDVAHSSIAARIGGRIVVGCIIELVRRMDCGNDSIIYSSILVWDMPYVEDRRKVTYPLEAKNPRSNSFCPSV